MRRFSGRGGGFAVVFEAFEEEVAEGFSVVDIGEAGEVGGAGAGFFGDGTAGGDAEVLEVGESHGGFDDGPEAGADAEAAVGDDVPAELVVEPLSEEGEEGLEGVEDEEQGDEADQEGVRLAEEQEDGEQEGSLGAGPAEQAPAPVVAAGAKQEQGAGGAFGRGRRRGDAEPAEEELFDGVNHGDGAGGLPG